MKRTFTFLFASLFLCMGTMLKAATGDAKDLADGYYTFVGNNTGKYATYNGDSRIVPMANAEEVTSFYRLTKGTDGYYTIQTSDGKFVTYKGTSGGDQIAIVTETDATDQNKWWVIREGNEEKLFTIVPKQDGIGANTPGWNYAVSVDGKANAALGFWDCSDAGSQWRVQFFSANTPVKVTYEFRLGDKVYDTVAKLQAVGDAIDAPAIPFVSFSNPEETVTAESGTVRIECTENLPFAVTTDLNNPVWQVVEIHRFGTFRVWKYVGDGVAVEVEDHLADKYNTVADEMLWCFVGNLIDGFSIYNKAAGTSKTLNDATEGYVVGTAQDNNHLWKLAKSSDSQDPAAVCFTRNGKYINRSGEGKLTAYAYPDNGSTCYIFTPSELVLGGVEAIEAVQNLPVGTMGTYVISEDTQAELDAAVAAVKANGTDVAKCQVLATCITAIENGEKIEPAAGDYYIKGTGVGNNANWYLTYDSEGKLMAAELTEGEKLSSKHVWSFETIEDEDGYKLKSKDLDKYADALIAAGDPTYITSDYASGAKYTFTDNGSAKYIIKDGNDHVMRTENSGVINYWDSSTGKEVNEAWYLISVSAFEEAYDLSGLVEGEWEDITNDDVIANPDLSSLEAWGTIVWNATNKTSYDTERGVMEFVAGENTEAKLVQNGAPFAKGTYRLTGKAYHKGAVNAVMFVGDKEVEIPEAEDFVEVTLEFTAEGAEYGTDYLNLGYSCEFDNAEDILVVGGFKLESKESLTLEEKFKSVYDGNGMPNDNTFAYYDWELQGTYTALYPAYQPVLAAAQEISTALNAGELVLKSDVEQSVADMEAMLAEIKAIVNYAQTTLMDATGIAYSILGTLEESDPAAVEINAAIAATEDMSTVTAVADLEAMVADINEAIAPYCDLSEGSWLDVTADYVVNGNLSSTEGWTISVTPQDTRTDLRVIEYWVGGQANGGKVSQSVSLPAGEYRLTGKSLYRQGWAWDANKEKSLGYMFAGENKVLVKTLGSLELDAYPNNVTEASAAFYEKDLYSNELNITLAEEGTVEIGYETAFDTEGGSWFIFGAMKLEKKLTLKDKFLADLEAFAAFAENPALEVLAAQESKVDDLLWEANKLKANIVAGKSVLKADVEKAIADMAAVTEEVTVCINYYDKSFAPALSAAEEILAKSTAGAEDVAAFEAALNAATKDMWQAAEVADLEARVAALETARQAYVVKAVPEEGFTFDYTFLIQNAQVTSADGWTNANIAATATYTGAPDAKAIDIGWNATVNVYQEIAGLPAGQYVLSAIARSKSPESTIYMTANGITVNVAFPQNDAAGGALGGGWEEVRTDTISVVDGNLTIGLDVKNPGQNHIGADNFHLYYVSELPDVEATGVKLDQDKVTLRFVGDVVQLNATIEPADASDRTLEWGTSNDEVASVDANGLVTAVGAGTATITVATENGMEATCAVTVEIVSGEIDMTSVIVNADLSTSYAENATSADWNIDGTKGISGGMAKVGSGSSIDFSQTITLPAGQYKMTAKAAYRYDGDEQKEYDAIKAGTDTHYATLYAEVGDEKFETDVQNRWEGRSETDYFNNLEKVSAIVHENVTYYVPNSSDAVKAWFGNGKYVNELVFNVQKAGKVKIGIVKTESPEVGDYVNIGAWTLTRLGTVGIDCVESVEAAPVIYDLAGRRVEKAVKGIYIVNGKKVVIK